MRLSEVKTSFRLRKGPASILQSVTLVHCCLIVLEDIVLFDTPARNSFDAFTLSFGQDRFSLIVYRSISQTRIRRSKPARHYLCHGNISLMIKLYI